MEGSSVVVRKGSGSGHERKVETARIAWYGSILVEEEGVDCCGGRKICCFAVQLQPVKSGKISLSPESCLTWRRGLEIRRF